MSRALEPVLAQAAALTDAALTDAALADAARGGASQAEGGREDMGLAPPEPPGGGPARVENRFNVSVQLGAEAPLDAEQLEALLVEVLRRAARRHGLEP